MTCAPQFGSGDEVPTSWNFVVGLLSGEKADEECGPEASGPKRIPRRYRFRL